MSLIKHAFIYFFVGGGGGSVWFGIFVLFVLLLIQ